MKLSIIKFTLVFAGISAMVSCKKYFDINKDPDRLPASTQLYPQLLTSAQTTLGFEGGSDLFRYTTLHVQHMSGLASSPNQTYEYSRYNINGSDQNNVWGQMMATTLSDLELIIKQAQTAGAPHYSGVAKVLKAYENLKAIDTWGDIPYSEAQQLDLNTKPKYDDDEAIYNNLIQLINEGINEMNAAVSIQSPGANSVIYPGTWATARPLWIKFANTLKLRIYIHYSKINPAFCVQQINALVNSGAAFMASNAESFQMAFFDVAGARNPISQFEVSRPNYLFASRSMLEMMLSRTDPRLPSYFAIFPFDFTPFSRTTDTVSVGTSQGVNLRFNSTTTAIAVGMTVTGPGIPPYTIVKSVTVNTTTGKTTVLINDDETPNFSITPVPASSSIGFQPAYRGISEIKPPLAPNNNYSRIHSYLRGAVVAGTAAPAPYTGIVQPFTYAGAAPQKMLTYAEYCFIRAEAALMGATGNAQQFFTDGITASMQDAGVIAANITSYLAAYGTLSGTPTQQLRRIIEEKYLASFGITVEPWTDWRRTGYPVLNPVITGVIPAIPRIFFYPQSEIDLNPNNPGQRPADLQSRVFWDN